MKKTALILSFFLFTLLGCKKNFEPLLPLPVQIWSSGCVELAPFEGAYRLSGMCCEYVLLPAIKANKQGNFKVQGSFHSYTGAGFSNVPIEITGNLSPDAEKMTLRYSMNGQGDSFVLVPGKAKLMCDCFCD